MAVYDTDKILNWYDDFTNCKSKYLNKYYQEYKSSYVVSNGNYSIVAMKRNLDEYYSKIKNAYSKIGTTWKAFYKDLLAVDNVFAGENTVGAIKASLVSSKINNMPKLIELKQRVSFSIVRQEVGTALVSGVAAVTSSVGQSIESVNQTGALASTGVASGKATIAANVVGPNISRNLNIADNVSEQANESGSVAETVVAASVGSLIGSILGPIGAIAGAAVGTILSKTGVVSKIKNWVVGLGESLKNIFNNLAKSAKQLVTDLKGLTEATSVNAVLDVFENAAATVATGVTSLLEGVIKLGEDIVDLVVLLGTAVASIGTGLLDLGNLIASKITGEESNKTDYTKQIWDATRAFVSTNYVDGLFDKLYDNTSLGQWMKDNAYGFDAVRSIGTAVGEVLGIVAISLVTFGAGGVAIGATTVSSSAITATMYGASKVAEHTETNWQDENTSTAGGLFKGIAQGTMDGLFFYAGAKGDQVAKSAAKSITEQAVKTGSKEALNQARKEAGKVLGKKMLFEAGTAVVQEFSTLGIDAIFSKNTIIDEAGNIIKFNNLSDKINYYYEKAGGTQGIIASVGTASILSFLSDKSDTLGQIKKFTKPSTKQLAKTTVSNSVVSKIKDGASDSLNKIKSSVPAAKQKASDAMASASSVIHKSNLKVSNKLNQLKTNVLKFDKTNASIIGTAIGLKQTLKKVSSDSLNKIKSSVSAVKQKASDVATGIKGNIKNVSSKFPSKSKIASKLYNLSASASGLKTKGLSKLKELKEIILNTKGNLTEKTKSVSSKLSARLDLIKTKKEYAIVYRKLDNLVKKTGLDLDSYRKAKRGSQEYKQVMELADDILELRNIEKNLGISSYFENINSEEVTKNIYMGDMNMESLLARYNQLTNKLDSYNVKHLSLETISNIETLKNIDDTLSKLDTIEQKLGYSNGFYSSNTDLAVVNSSNELVVNNNQSLTNYVGLTPYDIDEGITLDFSKLKNVLKKVATGSTIAVAFASIVNNSNNEEGYNAKNVLVDSSNNDNTEIILEDENYNAITTENGITNVESTSEETSLKQNIYSNIKIGDSVSNYNLNYGHTNAYDAVSGNNPVELISSVVNENSIFNRFAIVNDDGSITNITDAKGITLQQFCEQNDIDPSVVAVDVSREDGKSQAWVSVSELTNEESDN